MVAGRSPASFYTNILHGHSSSSFASATTGQNFKGDQGPSKLERVGAMLTELQQEENLMEQCRGHMVSAIRKVSFQRQLVVSDLKQGALPEDHYFSLMCKNARGNACLG